MAGDEPSFQQAAKFSGDEKQAAMASQSILTLLAATRVDPADTNCRVPVHSSLVCNRVGFAAVVALAIYELPAADAKLIAEAEASPAVGAAAPPTDTPTVKSTNGDFAKLTTADPPDETLLEHSIAVSIEA